MQVKVVSSRQNLRDASQTLAGADVDSIGKDTGLGSDRTLGRNQKQSNTDDLVNCDEPRKNKKTLLRPSYKNFLLKREKEIAKSQAVRDPHCYVSKANQNYIYDNKKRAVEELEATKMQFMTSLRKQNEKEVEALQTVMMR